MYLMGANCLPQKKTMTLFCVFCNIHNLSHQKNEHNFGFQKVTCNFFCFFQSLYLLSYLFTNGLHFWIHKIYETHGQCRMWVQWRLWVCTACFPSKQWLVASLEVVQDDGVEAGQWSPWCLECKFISVLFFNP